MWQSKKSTNSPLLISRTPMRRSIPLLLVFVLSCIFASWAAAQPQRGGVVSGETLQAGVAVARTIGRGQVHMFRIPLQQGDFAEVIVDQKGVDVIVRSVSS